MLRQVMTPCKGNYTIFIPAKFYRKETEGLAFPFYNKKANQNSDSINDIPGN
ncbi:MAG: hypothetical protein LBV17_00380 [Treponema sp.]|jgi:hypothetical protein|nr:hypothetical protein [Treponema sp.]